MKYVQMIYYLNLIIIQDDNLSITTLNPKQETNTIYIQFYVQHSQVCISTLCASENFNLILIDKLNKKKEI